MGQILPGTVEQVLESLRHKLHLVVEVDTVVFRMSINVEFKFIFKILPGSTILLPLFLRVSLHSRFQILQLLRQTRRRQYCVRALPNRLGLKLSRIEVNTLFLLLDQLIESFVFLLSFLLGWCLNRLLGLILAISEDF